MEQENIAVRSKRVYVIALTYLSKFHNYQKSFMEMSAADIANFLRSLAKPRDIDPNQGWISYHNTMGATISKFYRWIYYKELSPYDRRHRLTPEQLSRIPQLQQLHFISTAGKPKSPVTASDKWTEEDFATALKFVAAENPRLACYIAMAKDMSYRPHEGLAIRFSDINIKKASDGTEYAAVEIGRYGKKKCPRIVPMVDSIKYYREWRAKHPGAANPNSFVFISTERSAKYKNIPISPDSIRLELIKLKEQYLPTLLLTRTDLTDTDRARIKKLLTRKFTPYGLRHSSIQLYANKGVSNYNLALHAGWSKTSSMIKVYTAESGGESCANILMQAYNLDIRDQARVQQVEQELRGRACPSCGVFNVNSALTCIECGKTMDNVKLGLIIEEAERNKREFEQMKEWQKYQQKELKRLSAYLEDYIKERGGEFMLIDAPATAEASEAEK